MDSFFLCVWPIDLYSSMVWPFLAFCLSLFLFLSLSLSWRENLRTRARKKNRSEAKWWSLDLYHRNMSINLCIQVRLGDKMIILEREREKMRRFSLSVTQLRKNLICIMSALLLEREKEKERKCEYSFFGTFWNQHGIKLIFFLSSLCKTGIKHRKKLNSSLRVERRTLFNIQIFEIFI